MTYLATHITTDGTCNGKFVGNEKVSDSLEHHPIYKCQQTKKLAFVWQLHANASDLFVEAAIDKLGAKADEFILKKEKESNLLKGGSANDVILVELLASFRDKAFKQMSHGMMDICQNDNQYRKNLSGLETAEAEGLVAETKKLVTYQLQTFIRYTQFMANTVWKDVAGENIDFASNIPKWPDLNAAKKTELETLEKNILETVGPSFKVIEANLKKETDKELFVQYQRRMLDTQMQIQFVLNNASSKNTFQKLSMNMQELKADGHLLMKLLEEQKWVSGDEEKEMKLVRVVIDQIGHTLESAQMWKHLFKRAHDDNEVLKRIIDDFSMCLLVNQRYKQVSYIVKMHNIYKELVWDDQKQDKGNDYEFDSSFFKNVAQAYPNFVLDALNKKTNDEDLEWVHRQKLAMKLDIFKVYGRMLYGPQTNIVVTHAYNKMDVAKEYEAVHNRQRKLLDWKMKHNNKNIENKMWACKGCGGPWALQKLWRQPNFYRDVDMVKVNDGTKPDNKHFMVAHRILGSSSLVAKQVLVLDYKFNAVNKDKDIISDIKVPSKFNKKQFKIISDKLLKLANNPQSNKDLTFNSIDKEMYVRYKKQEDFIAAGENKGSKIETAAGSKVFLFQETGKTDKVCIEALINASDSDDLIIVDKHKYQYLVVGVKTLSISAEDCETIGISTAIALNETSLYYPILVNREQEFQKLSIAWAYQSTQLSEGIEDEGNMEGITQIDFFDTKDADPAVTQDATESNKMINSSIGKRDITVYDKVRDNVKCVFKNHAERTMESQLKVLMPNVIDLALPEFNLEEKKEGVDCADITKLLKWDSAKEFVKSAIELKKSSAETPLTSFAVCNTYRKTVKMKSKMDVLHIVNWKGEFKEKKMHSSPQVHGEYFLHVRVNQSFAFLDFLKTKMVPAHWLKLEPVPMGEKKEKLQITILVRLTSTSQFLGLTTENSNHFNKKPEFEFPGFDKVKDKINTHLMQQIQDKGIFIEEFKKSFTEFVANKAKDIEKHREFIKVRQGHNATEGCDKGVRGISIHINEKQEIEETCGTFLFGMQPVYQIELIYLSTKTASKIQGAKFPPPTEEEMDVAGVNGYVLVDAGMKNDEMDVKIGVIKKRIWVRPNITLPYELHTEKK